MTPIRHSYSTISNPPFIPPSPPRKWYPLPFGVGLLIIGTIQYGRVSRREKALTSSSSSSSSTFDSASPSTSFPSHHDPQDIQIQGPWQVHVLSTLPLRSISRLWGWINELHLPLSLRSSVFNLYSWAFDCNLEEMENPDLSSYSNLSEFFYRSQLSNLRPTSLEYDLVSPADGKVLSLGRLTGKRIHHVKGKSYGMDSLLGFTSGFLSDSPTSLENKLEDNIQDSQLDVSREKSSSPSNNLVTESEFAEINFVDYSLDKMLGEEANQIRIDSTSGTAESSSPSNSSSSSPPHPSSPKLNELDTIHSSSITQTISPTSSTSTATPACPPSHPSQLHPHAGKTLPSNHELFYCVIYLAPGDYHRFHSPADWMVTLRRHFSGELFSVSPYMVSLLSNLFVLNERVVLLGEWKHGLMAMVPVGATNVGTIRVNFDEVE